MCLVDRNRAVRDALTINVDLDCNVVFELKLNVRNPYWIVL
jgi:hypothetical protein